MRFFGKWSAVFACAVMVLGVLPASAANASTLPSEGDGSSRTADMDGRVAGATLAERTSADSSVDPHAAQSDAASVPPPSARFRQ